MKTASKTSSRARPAWIHSAYLLLALVLTYMLSAMDRMALSLMVDPIRSDLGLSDVQISLLIGFAFVLLYSTTGIPFGRLADTHNRKALIIVGLIVWSMATAACGLANSFATLLATRILVGLGEATLSPAAYSLIASTFPPERIGIASSFFSLGLVFGTGLAPVVIGWISGALQSGAIGLPIEAGTQGWRGAFIMLALFSVPALLLLAMLREPRSSARGDGGAAPSLGAALAHFREHRRLYGGIIGGSALMTICNLGAMLWAPTYFARVHGLSTSEIGLVFGLSFSGAATLGAISSGLLADRLFKRGVVDASARIIIAVEVVQLPLLALAYLSPSTPIAVTAFAIASLVMGAAGGIQLSTIQLTTPERLRGLATSLYLMGVNLIGQGLGPLIIALLTQHVFGRPEAIGQSLALTSLVCGSGAAAILALTLRQYRALVLSTRNPT